MSDRDEVLSSAGNSGAPALSVHGLSKHFGDRVAFDDVSFEVGHGEVFGFLGPNGAGKTTMQQVDSRGLDGAHVQREATRGAVAGSLLAAARTPDPCMPYTDLRPQ